MSIGYLLKTAICQNNKFLMMWGKLNKLDIEVEKTEKEFIQEKSVFCKIKSNKNIFDAILMNLIQNINDC